MAWASTSAAIAGAAARTIPELHEHFAGNDLAAVDQLSFESGRTLPGNGGRQYQCGADAAGHDRNTQPGATHDTLPGPEHL